MSIKEAESSIAVLEAELAKLDAMDPHADELRLQIDHLREEAMLQLDAWDTVYLARHPKRPKAADYIRALFRISWSCMVIAAMEMMRPVRAALRPFMEEV